MIFISFHSIQLSFQNLAPSTSILLPFNIKSYSIFSLQKTPLKLSLFPYLPKVWPTQQHLTSLTKYWVSNLTKNWCNLDQELLSPPATLYFQFFRCSYSHKASNTQIQKSPLHTLNFCSISHWPCLNFSPRKLLWHHISWTASYFSIYWWFLVLFQCSTLVDLKPYCASETLRTWICVFYSKVSDSVSLW